MQPGRGVRRSAQPGRPNACVTRTPYVVLAVALLWFLLPTRWGMAQISPGPLARPHVTLEGIKNCTHCHELGGGASGEKCLSCHRELKVRLDAGAGYHNQVVNVEKKSCFGCHSDHAGRAFQMVHWPKGRDKFDHAATGYALAGKHRALRCRDCHKPQFIREDLRSYQKDIDLDRTFLGLRKDCLSCHFDEHRKQLGQNCLRCHGQKTWKPAARFDHNQARFRLTGRHVSLDCGRCHAKVRDRHPPDQQHRTFIRFTGLSFRNCTPCHGDAHAGKFGSDCKSCHQTSAWKIIRRGTFDHSRTRFPLRGQHAQVACEKCHTTTDMTRPLNFAQCRDCHSDIHLGQFRKRKDGGRCDSCHNEKGFVPALFGIREHQRTRFPLTGAHMAEPCNSCHKLEVDRRGQRFRVFSFNDLSCMGCHDDVHKGQFASRVARSGCEGCHRTESWQKTLFDHSKSRFPLVGKHRKVSCRQCHRLVDRGTAMQRTLFKPMDRRCVACHTDPHLGQFRKTKPVKTCNECHTPESWQNLRFVHNRDSGFRLEGAHQKVSCAGCHKRKHVAGRSFVLYRPIDRSCKTCHSGAGSP